MKLTTAEQERLKTISFTMPFRRYDAPEPAFGERVVPVREVIPIICELSEVTRQYNRLYGAVWTCAIILLAVAIAYAYWPGGGR